MSINLNSDIAEIEIAFKALDFAFKLTDFIQNEGIDPRKFDIDRQYQEVHQKLPIIPFPSGSFSSKALMQKASNIVYLMAFSSAALTLSDYMKQHFPNAEDELKDLKDITYAIRCVFAHSIGNPIWDLRNPNLRRQYRFNGKLFCDLTDRHGTGFENEDINGLVGLLKLKELVLKAHKNRH